MTDIFILDLKTGDMRNLTQSEHSDRQPIWSSDGTQIAFTRNVDGNYEIFAINSDGGIFSSLPITPAGIFFQPGHLFHEKERIIMDKI